MEEQDVNKEETPTEEPSPAEKTVPYSRFKEVNEKAKELEQKLETAKTSTTPQAKTKEEQAEEYLSKLTEKALDKREAAQKAAQAKEKKEFNAEVDDLLSVHTDVKKDEFLKFMEENGDKYGVKSVKGAMSLYKDLVVLKKNTAEETKDSLSKKPGLPKSEGIPGSGKTYDDKGKTLEQIKEEAIAELESKSK